MSILSVKFIAITMVAIIVLFAYGHLQKIVNEKYRACICNILLASFSIIILLGSSKYELLFYMGYVLVIYLCGLFVHKSKKWLVFLVIIGVLPLLVFKYIGLLGIQSTFFPIGISYVTFKSLAYICDVYKGKCEREKNILVLFSYILFFPELFIGPIDKTDGLLVQLKNYNAESINYCMFVEGINLILWGLFQKMVIADRIGIYVNTIYNQIYSKEGFEVLIAVLLYSVQIYLDFSGCTNIILGIGRLMGYKLPINFMRPYLAITVSDFWRRWHVSLTNWLREYIYIPLGGSKKGILRKNINIIIVFVISGVWHGSGMNFFVWGLLNGIFQVVGGLTLKWRNSIIKKAGFEVESSFIVLIRRIGVFFWMTVAWTFFRAESVGQALLVFRKILSSWNPGVLFDGSLYKCGLNQRNWFVMFVFIIIVCIVEYMSEKGTRWQQKYRESHFIIKGLIWYALIVAIIVFGIYGSGYDAAQFIYENF